MSAGDQPAPVVTRSVTAPVASNASLRAGRRTFRERVRARNVNMPMASPGRWNRSSDEERDVGISGHVDEAGRAEGRLETVDEVVLGQAVEIHRHLAGE